MNPSLAIGAGTAVGIYLVVLISVGYATRRRGAQTGLGDFYLAGRNLGGFVLLLTLYATQYSGNTLLGYPGEAFRIGYAWVMSVGFMMAIIVVYLVFAPRRKVVLVHGCFWHGHDCRNTRLPATRVEYWSAKIANNRARDARNIRDLEAAGWRVHVVWECETADLQPLACRLVDFLNPHPS